MLRRGRPVDNNFRDWEILYRACDPEDILENRIIPARIAVRDISVNWSRYSAPADVLYQFPGWGIARLFVRDLPFRLPKDPPKDSKIHKFAAEHDPLDENYGHCEICSYKEEKMTDSQKRSEWVKVRDLPTTVKKELRTALGDAYVLMHSPQ